MLKGLKTYLFSPMTERKISSACIYRLLELFSIRVVRSACSLTRNIHRPIQLTEREREREKGHHMNFCLLLAIYLLVFLYISRA